MCAAAAVAVRSELREETANYGIMDIWDRWWVTSTTFDNVLFAIDRRVCSSISLAGNVIFSLSLSFILGSTATLNEQINIFFSPLTGCASAQLQTQIMATAAAINFYNVFFMLGSRAKKKMLTVEQKKWRPAEMERKRRRAKRINYRID